MKNINLAVGIVNGVGLHHYKAYQDNPFTYVKYLCDFDEKSYLNLETKKTILSL